MKSLVIVLAVISVCLAPTRGALADDASTVEAGDTPQILEPTSGGAAGVETPELGWSSAPSGRLSADYVQRGDQPTDVGDQDLFATLLVNWGSRNDRISGSIYARAMGDLDGIGGKRPPDGPVDRWGVKQLLAARSNWDPLRSSWDSLNHKWSGQLFHAYSDLRLEPGQTFLRLGRQFIYEGQRLHFDGGTLVTKEYAFGLKVSAFGGVPVRYFEDQVAGEWLAGASVEARPWRPVRVGVVYSHIEEETEFGGANAQGESVKLDLLNMTLNARLWHWGSVLVRYSAVNAQPRDLVLRARVMMQRLDVRGLFSFHMQPTELDETEINLSPYRLNRVESESSPNQAAYGVIHPFRRLELSLFKDFRAWEWRLGLGGRATLRRLKDDEDEGAYNHDYEVFWYGVEVEAPAPWHLSLSAGRMSWRSPINDTNGFDAELRWRPTDAYDLRAGTSYALFKYGVVDFSGFSPTLTEERTGIREIFLKFRWETPWKADLRLRYAVEEEDDEWIHKMRLGWSLGF